VPAYAQTAGQPSPPVTDTIASSGGTAAVDHSGGGGETIAACMGFWDTATHMSKVEWRETCKRTLNGLDLPPDGGKSITASAHGTVHARHARNTHRAE
jgi:hypothetical protein